VAFTRKTIRRVFLSLMFQSKDERGDRTERERKMFSSFFFSLTPNFVDRQTSKMESRQITGNKVMKVGTEH
jgi:hypothetical protein